MRDYYNDPPEPDIAPEDEAIWEILESAGTDEETIKKVSAIVYGLLCEIGRLRNLGESKEYSLSTEAQPEVTGAVATVGEPMATGGYRIFADSGYLAKGTKLYPPSAIEAAVREKLEEVVNMIEHTPSLKDPDDTARLIQNKVRALMESPQPSVEEPAN